MTRATKSSRAHNAAAPPGADPVAAALEVLQATTEALGAGAIKQRITARGLDVSMVAKAWPAKVRPTIAKHPDVEYKNKTYRWTGPSTAVAPVPVPPIEELSRVRAQLVQVERDTERVRAELVQAQRDAERVRAELMQAQRDTERVRAELMQARARGERTSAELTVTKSEVGSLAQRCADLEQRLAAQPDGGGDSRSAQLRQAQERQLRIDGIRALAQLAMEVEELTVNEVEPRVLIHRVRARVRREGLQPIESAGAETTFDRRRHKPIAGGIGDGEPVSVVRPGYTWKAAGEDVLIDKAVVEE